MRHLFIGLWLAGSLPTASPGTQEGAPAISGVVKFEGTPKPWKLNDLIDRDKHGGPGRDGKDILDETVLLGDKGQLANVLVRVKGRVAGSFDAPKDPVDLEMRAYFFRPRVVVLQPGRKLRVKNGDFDNLNVSGKPSRNSGFSVNMVKGGSHEVQFTEAEVAIRLQHDCCPWQVAWIHVLDHPFFAVTGKDGAFKIANLPAGTYELEAWHERFGTRTATVTVGAKETKAQDFTFAAENK